MPEALIAYALGIVIGYVWGWGDGMIWATRRQQAE